MALPHSTSIDYWWSSLLGQPVEILLPERVRAWFVAWTQGYRAAPRVRAMGAGRELELLWADGAQLPRSTMMNRPCAVTAGYASGVSSRMESVTVTL